jgi:hypothetical protein
VALGGIEIKEEVDARKQSLQGEEAWELMAGAARIMIASGQKIDEIVPDERGKGALLAMIIGRTGNLRAPTLRRDDVFYVGYNDELYRLIISD